MKYKYLIFLLLLPILAGAQITIDNNKHTDEDLQLIDFSEIDTVGGDWVARDVSGNGYDLKLVDSYCALFDGYNDYLELGDIGDVTIVSWGGTSTPTKTSSTRIDFTAGTMFDLLLSNGSLYHFADGERYTAHDAINLNHGTCRNITPNTFWNLDDIRPSNLIDGYSSAITGGASYYTSTATIIGSNKAYGTWEFVVTKKYDNGIIQIPIISNSENTTLGTFDGYCIYIYSDEEIRFYKTIGGVNTKITSLGYVTLNESMKVKITRNNLGVFSIVVGETLFSPYNSPEITESLYMGFNFRGSDIFSNIYTPDGAVDLAKKEDQLSSTVLIYLPVNPSGLDINGESPTNPAGNWHNNAETKMEQYSNAVLQAHDPNFWYNGSTPRVKTWAEIPSNYAGKIFSDVTVSTKTNISMGHILPQTIDNNNSGKIYIQLLMANELPASLPFGL